MKKRRERYVVRGDVVELKTQNPNPFLSSDLQIVVEMGGVEPPSESTLTGISPGADGYLTSLARARTVTLGDAVASLCMARSKLCALTFTTDRRPSLSRGPLRWDAR